MSTSVRSLCWKVSCIPHSHHCSGSHCTCSRLSEIFKYLNNISKKKSVQVVVALVTTHSLAYTQILYAHTLTHKDQKDVGYPQIYLSVLAMLLFVAMWWLLLSFSSNGYRTPRRTRSFGHHLDTSIWMALRLYKYLTGAHSTYPHLYI